MEDVLRAIKNLGISEMKGPGSELDPVSGIPTATKKRRQGDAASSSMDVSNPRADDDEEDGDPLGLWDAGDSSEMGSAASRCTSQTSPTESFCS